MVKVREDLTDRTFGKLKVIRQTEDYVTPKGVHSPKWLCECECGNNIEVVGYKLKNHHTQSCGCLQKERVTECNKKPNDYEVQEDYVIMYTCNNEPFFVDLEDFWKVRDICWCNSNGYIVGRKNQKNIRIHRLILNCPNNMDVDHINHNTFDNRKENLRIVTRSQNNMNMGLRSTNTSGVTGVGLDIANNKWTAQIGCDGKTIYLGCYDNFDDAVKARKEAEDKYFGEYSYDNSQELVRK